MAIEIVDLPIKNSDFPYFFVCLPEGSFDVAGDIRENARKSV
jgi:hypothetical protein